MLLKESEKTWKIVRKNFFSDGNFAMQEAENLTEIWDTEGMAFCIWEYAGICEV